MQSVRETVDLGFATEEAIDAVHFALQELGVQYDVDPGTPVAVRSGPYGPVGVYALPPNELMKLAESAVQRTLTDAECEAVLFDPCPADVDVPENLPLRGGLDSYGATAHGPARAGGHDRHALGDRMERDQGFVRELARVHRPDRDHGRVHRRRSSGSTRLGPRRAQSPPGRRSSAARSRHGPRRVRLDISRFIDPETLRSDFGEYLLGAGTLTAESAAHWPRTARSRRSRLTIDLKGLVFYPEGRVRARPGYEIPNTWDELVALSHQIVADGGTPWCFGFESGLGADGPAPTSSRVWCFGWAASTSTTRGPPARSDSPARE